MPVSPASPAPPLILLDEALGEPLNAELEGLVLALSRSSEGRQSNMASGRSYFSNKWLSAKDLHLSSHPTLQQVAERLRQRAEAQAVALLGQEVSLQMEALWALVSRQGMTGRPHSHQGLISGAYYVAAGDSGQADSRGQAGDIGHADSRGQPGSGGLFLTYGASGQPDRRWQPRRDRLLLFPSQLVHAVSPYRSERPRITLSFNLGPAVQSSYPRKAST